jgi:hypothetical protein
VDQVAAFSRLNIYRDRYERKVRTRFPPGSGGRCVRRPNNYDEASARKVKEIESLSKKNQSGDW